MGDTVRALHAEVDATAAGLERQHAERLRCGRGCSACCVDELTVFEVEAERIRRSHSQLLASGTAAPVGGCAFLAENGDCRIYDDRPYVCRTQGLPLRWFEESADGEILEQRDICELNVTDTPLSALPEEAHWTLGPYEDRLIRIQCDADGGEARRVRLRALFASEGANEA